MWLQFNTKFLFLSLTLLAVIAEVSADIFFKKWANTNLTLSLIIGFVFYSIGALFWATSLKYELLSRAGSIFTLINYVAIVLVGIFLFGETIPPRSALGVILGLLSILLLEFG